MPKKTQPDAVVEVMERHGGYATLGFLYQNVPVAEWRTKTPYASMRRIVQQDDRFFKIKPGLWALKSHRDKLPEDVTTLIETPGESPKEQDVRSHYYYQGMLAELGKMQGFKTYIPAQDKNRPYLDKRRLGEVASMTDLPCFTYPRIINRIRSIDVIWLNDHGLPGSVFEIEYSTDFKNSLIKFLELVDFHTEMRVVAPDHRVRQFEDIMTMNAFTDLRSRVRFLPFDRLESLAPRQAILPVEDAGSAAARNLL